MTVIRLNWVEVPVSVEGISDDSDETGKLGAYPLEVELLSKDEKMPIADTVVCPELDGRLDTPGADEVSTVDGREVYGAGAVIVIDSVMTIADLVSREEVGTETTGGAGPVE